MGLSIGRSHHLHFHSSTKVDILSFQAIQPTEKSFRPSHRASVHDSILHDASYNALIELKGAQVVLKSLLEAVCDLQGQGPGARRYITGARTCDIKMYKPRQYPFGFIGPMVVMWRPRERGAAQNEEGTEEGESRVPHEKSLEMTHEKPRRKRGKKKQDGQFSLSRRYNTTKPNFNRHSG